VLIGVEVGDPTPGRHLREEAVAVERLDMNGLEVRQRFEEAGPLERLVPCSFTGGIAPGGRLVVRNDSPEVPQPRIGLFRPGRRVPEQRDAAGRGQYASDLRCGFARREPVEGLANHDGIDGTRIERDGLSGAVRRLHTGEICGYPCAHRRHRLDGDHVPDPPRQAPRELAGSRSQVQNAARAGEIQ